MSSGVQVKIIQNIPVKLDADELVKACGFEGMLIT